MTNAEVADWPRDAAGMGPPSAEPRDRPHRRAGRPHRPRASTRRGCLLPPEPALCEAFSVSRTVVREAVKLLQAKGLVQIRQGLGTTVSSPLTWNMLDEIVLAASIAEPDGLDVLDDLVVTRRILEADMANVAAPRGRCRGDRTASVALVDGMDELVDDPAGVRRPRPGLPRPDHADVRQPDRPRRGAGAGEPGRQHRALHGHADEGPLCASRTAAIAGSTSASPLTIRRARPMPCSPTSPRPGWCAAAGRRTTRAFVAEAARR